VAVPERPPHRTSRTLEWTVIASHLAPPLLFSGVAVALPSMGQQLAASATELGLVETLFLAGSLAMLLPAGQLGDGSDKRTLYKLGLLAAGACALAVGCASSMRWILVLRLLQGCASAVFTVAGGAVLAELVPPERRGRAFGMAIGMTYAGLTLGPVAAGALVEHHGWRGVFVGGGVLLFTLVALAQALMPSGWRRPQRAPHPGSTGLLGVGVLALVFGTANIDRGPLGLALLALGGALLVAFVAWQGRLERPLLPVGMLRANRTLAGALGIQLLLYMNAFTSTFMLGLFLQVVLGAPAKTAGQVLATSSVLMALLAPVAGRLADRHPPRRVATLGVCGVLLAVLQAMRLDASSSLAMVAAALATQGLGYAFFSSPNMAIIINALPREAASTASSLSAAARSLGMVAGMLLAGVLIASRFGGAPVAAHPERLVETMRLAYLGLAGTTALALFVSLRGRA
jgi:MFS family permease